MALKPTILIPEQTGAVTTVAPFQVTQKMLPATLMASNLVAAETAAVLFSVDGGVTFEPLAQDDADLTLTAGKNTFTIVSPIMLGVTKAATVSAGGVFIMTDNPAGVNV